MIDKDVVDSALHRSIKPSPYFDKLISPPEKWERFVEKDGHYSNTYDTVKLMADGVKKYHQQLKEVAKVLKGKTIAETIDNNYKWLYNHFQYSLDENVQNFYTPQRAWKERYKGFDCKTFSILASILLYNQGIAHKIRKVKQSHVNPGFWSHVFIVIPHQGKELIIDATKHTNTVNTAYITEKFDIDMNNLKHQWLGNPGIATLACPGETCTCSGVSLKQSLGNPGALATAANNFHAFLNLLEKRGVSRAYTTALLNEVTSNLKKGIDPNLSEVFKKVDARFSHNQIVFGGALGVDLGNLATTGVATAIGGPAGGIIASVLPIDSIVSGTFGAVFSNGFNLSCWGASATPAESKEVLPLRLDYAAKKSGITQAINTNTLNSLSNIISALVQVSKNIQAKSSSNCTDEAHSLLEQGYLQFFDSILSNIKASGYTVTTANIVDGSLRVTDMPRWGNGAFNAGTGTGDPYKYQMYIVVPPSVNPNTNTGTNTTVSTGSTGGATQADDFNGNNAAPKKDDTATTVAVLGGVALAAKLLFF